MSYVVTIEGQKIPLPDEIGSDDVKVRQALAPYFPDAANALITRTEKAGEVVINVIKKAGTKGLQAGLQALQDGPGGKNPAVALYEAIKSRQEPLSPAELLELDSSIEQALEEGTKQNKAIRHAVRRLIVARPQPAPEVVQGF
jgi:hypothetical protein